MVCVIPPVVLNARGFINNAVIKLLGQFVLMVVGVEIQLEFAVMAVNP